MTNKLAKAHQCIHRFVGIAESSSNRIDIRSRGATLLKTFFANHVLGIMAHFSEVLDDVKGLQPLSEKKRSLRGMEEMIMITKGIVGIALPQVSYAKETNVAPAKARADPSVSPVCH